MLGEWIQLFLIIKRYLPHVNLPHFNNIFSDKVSALYIYVIAGPLSYESLCSNLQGSLPSISTVRRLLGKRKRIEEGYFRFAEIKKQMEERGEPMFVVCSEDDTKVSERPRYDALSDEIIGLQLPLNDEGIPIRHSFKFTTLSEAQHYLSTNSLATYAKLMTIRSLGPNAIAYQLVIYGTRGSDKAPDVHARWEFVRREFGKIGITVICKKFQFCRMI